MRYNNCIECGVFSSTRFALHLKKRPSCEALGSTREYIMKIITLVFISLLSTQAYASNCSKSVIPALEHNQNNEAVVAYLEALKTTVLFSDENVGGSYCQLHTWYKERMSSRRFGSRMLAVFIIVLGASLPLISILERIFKNQKFWVAFIGGSIVICQGFAQTFQYEESWRSFTVGKLELESAHRTWQKQIIDASIAKEGLPLAQRVTSEFSDSISNIVIKETTGFFDALTNGAKNET